MIAELMEGIICLPLNREPVLSGKSNKDPPDKSKFGFEDNSRATIFSLSAEDLNWCKGRGEEKLFLLIDYYRAANCHLNQTC